MAPRNGIRTTIALLGIGLGALGCAQTDRTVRQEGDASPVAGIQRTKAGEVALAGPQGDESSASGPAVADAPRAPSIGMDEAGAEARRQEEVPELEKMGILLQKAMLDFHAFRAAEEGTDFLRRSAARHDFVVSREALTDELKKASAMSPEFRNGDLQDSYRTEVLRPFEQLMRDSRDIMKDEGSRNLCRLCIVTEETARVLRVELQALVDGRKFTEASANWTNIDGMLHEPGVSVPPGAQLHVDAMRKMGERARWQTLLAGKRLDVQGTVRMERPAGKLDDPADPPGKAEIVAAIVVNGRIRFPGKNIDPDVVFRGVAEDGRLLFEYQGHEVDCILPK